MILPLSVRDMSEPEMCGS